MLTSLDKLKDSLKKHYDVFLASASYEKRSLSIINAISNEIKFGHKLVSLSIPHKDIIKENLKVFAEKEFSIVEVDNTNQIETVDNFVKPINDILKANQKASFLIDITTFTKQTLLILLRILRNVLTKENEIQFLYTTAKEYSVGMPLENKWLTRGILEVNSVFGYAGIIRPSRPYHLIILMGYEVERAASLITAYEPSKISVGYVKKGESTPDEHYELNKQNFDKLLAEFPYAESFEFSCVKVLDCKFDILRQSRKYAEYNVVVSPMNNKISTLSSALAAFDNDEIQLAIAIPAIYNYEKYSTPDTYCHVIEIPDFVKRQGKSGTTAPY